MPYGAGAASRTRESGSSASVEKVSVEKVTPVFAACLIVHKWAARIMVSHCTTIFALPSCHRDERRARKAVREEVEWGGWPEGGDGLALDVLDELEGCRGEAAVGVDDEGREGAAQGDTVGTVLGLLVPFTSGYGFAWGKGAVGGGVGVDTGEVEQDGAPGHEDLTVGKEVGKVLLNNVGKTVVAPGILAEEVA